MIHSQFKPLIIPKQALLGITVEQLNSKEDIVVADIEDFETVIALVAIGKITVTTVELLSHIDLVDKEHLGFQYH